MISQSPAYEPWQLSSVAVVNDYYVLTAAPYSWKVRVVDVSDPAQPVEVGGYATPAAPWHISVVANRAYVAAGGAGLLILDLTTPTVPVRVANADLGWDAQRIVLESNHAYVACSSFVSGQNSLVSSRT